MDERLLKIMKHRLNFNDEDFKLFKKRPENLEILERAKQIAEIEIAVEVVSSKGCNSRHRVGQKFYLDGAGNLLSSKSPSACCIFLLGNLPHFVYAIHELIYAGVEVEDIRLRFPRVGCGDVGVENCGWGHVIVEIDVHRKPS